MLFCMALVLGHLHGGGDGPAHHHHLLHLVTNLPATAIPSPLLQLQAVGVRGGGGYSLLHTIHHHHCDLCENIYRSQGQFCTHTQKLSVVIETRVGIFYSRKKCPLTIYHQLFNLSFPFTSLYQPAASNQLFHPHKFHEIQAKQCKCTLALQR